MDEQQNIIIYRTADGRAQVALFAKDGKIWLSQQQMAELFATSKPNISMHIANILKEKELYKNSVVKEFLTTAADGKNYNVVFYSLKEHRGLGLPLISESPLKGDRYKRG
jgi:hypothetical protein